jgi:hypothetical protein
MNVYIRIYPDFRLINNRNYFVMQNEHIFCVYLSTRNRTAVFFWGKCEKYQRDNYL